MVVVVAVVVVVVVVVHGSSSGGGSSGGSTLHHSNGAGSAAGYPGTAYLSSNAPNNTGDIAMGGQPARTGALTHASAKRNFLTGLGVVWSRNNNKK